MPHRTDRVYRHFIGVLVETFNSDLPEPCQQCGEPFGYSRRRRLKEVTTGKVIRGYRRVCHTCCEAYCDARWKEQQPKGESR